MTRFRSIPIASLLAFALTAFASAQAPAIRNYGAAVDVDYDYIVEESYDYTGPVELEIDHADQGRSYARAYSDLGVNKMVINSHTYEGGLPTGRLVAEAGAIWGDYLTISDPELDGTQGWMQASIRVEASGSSSLSGDLLTNPNVFLDTFWRYELRSRDADSDNWSWGGWGGSWSRGETGLDYSGDALQDFVGEIMLPFTYGKEFLMVGDLTISSEIVNDDYVGGSYSASLNLGNSVYWNGIKGLYDAGGNLVSDYGLSSSSGYDFRNGVQAVPEPASMAALGLGAAALLRRRRR